MIIFDLLLFVEGGAPAPPSSLHGPRKPNGAQPLRVCGPGL